MKNIISSLLFYFSFSLTSFAQNPDAILGKWITMTGNCIVEVYKQNKDYKAKVLWFKPKEGKSTSDWKDEKNPNPALRNRKLLGMDAMNGLQYDAKNNEWVDGRIYDATSGKEWDSVVWLTDDHLLKVKGYWVFKFVSQTKTFKRV